MYYDYVVGNIIELLETNLSLYALDDSKLKEIKKYCKRIELSGKKYPRLSWIELDKFTRMAIRELLEENQFYDFREE